jgi:hypothetical protein
MSSERDDDVALDVFLDPPADTGRFPVLAAPCERCSTFRRLEELSAAVAALRKLLSPVLVLVMDRGRLNRTAGRLRSFSSPLTPPGGVDEVTESGDKLLRERLKAAINLKAVRGYSEESGVAGVLGGISMLVLSDTATL